MVKVWSFKPRSKHSLDNTQGCTIKESTSVTTTTKKCATPVLLLPHQRENSTQNEFNRDRRHSQQRLEPPPTLAKSFNMGSRIAIRQANTPHDHFYSQPKWQSLSKLHMDRYDTYFRYGDATRIISQLFIQLSPYTVMVSCAHNAIQSFQ